MDQWYYQIELPGGTFTNGRPHGNLALCRQFFTRIDKRGLRCLDIGTQEFVAPVLFHRQGASEIVAYDRLNLEDRRRIICDAYETKFEYASRMPLISLKKSLQDSKINTVFDYVNFCGVLYHMIDPLCGLAMARSFLRGGGIMLLETSVSLDPGFVAHVNHEGNLYPGSNYFQVSLAALDYWIRMLHMEILDTAVLAGRGDISRMVAVCRAVDEPVAEPGDTWMSLGFIRNDMIPYGLDYDELKSSAPPVKYQHSGVTNVLHPGTNSVDLYKSFKQNGYATFDKNLSVLRLKDAA